MRSVGLLLVTVINRNCLKSGRSRTGQLLIIYSAFVKYLRKNGKKL